MEFFRELETVNAVKMSGLKAGKAAEQAEFDNLLRDVEKELDQAAAQAPRRRSEDEVCASSMLYSQFSLSFLVDYVCVACAFLASQTHMSFDSV